MGIAREFKLFLLYLFPNCFSENLPSNIQPTICILEAMPFLSKIFSLTKNSKLTITQLLFNLKSHIYKDILDKYKELRGLVILFDNVFYVPGNKSFVEMKRDSNKNSTTKTYLNEEEYIKERIKRNLKDDDLFFNDGSTLDLDGTIIWRDCNFRWILHYLVTRELLKLDIPKSKFVVIDEGIFFEKKYYPKLRKEILVNNQLTDPSISIYEKDCLISTEILSKKFQRGTLFDDKKLFLEPSLNIGESDLRILSNIKRNENNDIYVVESNDGDTLINLLKHAKSMLNPETFEFDNEIFLDTQTVSDKSSDNDRKYRFINITLLYKSIIEFFKEEFRNIKFPIETLSFLILSYFSDFTPKVSKKLSVGPVKIWNCFANLHSTNIKGYFPFTTGFDKKGNQILKDDSHRVQSIILNDEFKGILNHDAMIIESYNNSTHQSKFDPNSKSINFGYFSAFYLIKINEKKFLNFYYFIYQQILLPKLKKLNIIPTEKPIFNYNELFEHSKKINDSGLLSPNELLTRLQQILWTINYMQNGWKSQKYFSQNFYAKHLTNNRLTLYGWKLKPYDGKEQFPRSSNFILKYEIEPKILNLQNKIRIWNIYNFYTVEACNASDEEEHSKILNLVK